MIWINPDGCGLWWAGSLCRHAPSRASPEMLTLRSWWMVIPLLMTRTVQGAEVIVGLLFASSGIEPEIAQAAERLEITPGLVVPVATVGYLIALKILARDDVTRPQDLADLRALITSAAPHDLSVADEAVMLIEARGFNLDRDLRKALEDLVAELRT